MVVESGVEADVTAIACPVYSEARIVAALSLVVPTYRLTAEEAAHHGRMLTSAAAGVSAQLSRRNQAFRRTVMITFDNVSSGPRPVRAPRGSEISCKGWQQEAALRMLMNNLDPEVAEHPEDLVVYGGTGRAARSWEAFDAIVAHPARLWRTTRPCWCSPASRSGCSAPTNGRRGC